MGFLEICKSDKLVSYGSKQNECGCKCVNEKDPKFIYTYGSLYNKMGQGGYAIYSSRLNINLENCYPYGEHKNLVPKIELKSILEAIRHIKLRHHSWALIEIFTDYEFALVHLVNMVDGKEDLALYNKLGATILREIKEDQKWLAKVVLHKIGRASCRERVSSPV